MQIIRRENFLEILAENGNPPYLYSLDNVNWQTSNIFKNLSAGIYQIYVKSQTNSCTAVATSAVLFIPNAFTPNHDGYYTISNTTEYLPWGWQKSLDHTKDPSGTYGNMLVVNADYSTGEFSRNFSRKW